MDLKRSVSTVVASILVVAAVVALFGNSRDPQLRPTTEDFAAHHHHQQQHVVPLVHVDPITVPSNCTNVFDWNFFNAKLTQNNLGGLGPNFDDKPEIRYSGVKSGTGPSHDGAVDLVITVAKNSKKYKTRAPDHNGLNGQFGVINIAPTSRATFHFQFVEGGTDTPITMSADDTVIFSFYDMDNEKKGHEFIEFITPTYSHSLEPETTVKCTGSGADGTLYAESGRFGDGADNPSDPLHMTALQLNSRISVTYKGVSGWTVMMGNSVRWGGRNTLFGGRSENDCACIGVSKWHVENNLKFNNLGGMGPVFTDPPELRYENVLVTPWTNHALDLVVTNTSTYHVESTSFNGLWPTIDPGHQQMGQINVKSGTQTTFDFTFVETGTNTPYYLSNAFLSIYDLDERAGKIPNYEYAQFPQPVTQWALTTPTEVLKSGANDGTLMFRSTQPGYGDDNPTDPEHMTGLQMARSVTIWQASTASFQATFGHWYDEAASEAKSAAQHGRKVQWGGRNFLFAGPGVFCPT
jgi:hypothetical protein